MSLCYLFLMTMLETSLQAVNNPFYKNSIFILQIYAAVTKSDGNGLTVSMCTVMKNFCHFVNIVNFEAQSCHLWMFIILMKILQNQCFSPNFSQVFISQTNVVKNFQIYIFLKKAIKVIRTGKPGRLKLKTF